MSKFPQQYGPWALITGASSGIGREYALQLAAEGLNVAVLARRKERLESLVQEIEATHQVETRIIVADLTTPDAVDIIQASTSDITIGLLVNNAGDGVPGAFLKQDVRAYQRTIQLNVTIPMALSHHFGEQMRRRGKGGIIFTASTAGYTGSPYLANYAAAKSYMISFGMALHTELKESGVDVLVLSPGATRTEMIKMEGTSMKDAPMPWMDADQVARIGIKNLGKKTAVIPGVVNNIMVFMMSRLMPRSAAMNMFGSMMFKIMDPAIVTYKLESASA
jgi:short-subunit dehydrogenase